MATPTLFACVALIGLIGSSFGNPLTGPGLRDLRCPPTKGLVGICVERCSGDDGCGAGLKCCSNGCGHSCQKPIGDVICPVMRCAAECEFGYVTRENGCRTCDCKLNPCALLRCAGCRVVNGKAVCGWPVDECPRMACEPCRHGYVEDDKGCRTCECKTDPCQSFPCPRNQKCELVPLCLQVGPCKLLPRCVDACPQIRCRSCPYGHVYDSNGCKTCKCRPNPCDNQKCRPGQKCYLQKVACVRAPCPPKPTCEDVCPPVRCLLWCPAGFKKDARGCQTCQCENTCAFVRCRPGYACRVIGGRAVCHRGSPFALE